MSSYTHREKSETPRSVSEQRRVDELLAALRTPVNRVITGKSTLVDGVFAEEFESRLLAQHVFLGTPLFQESFDAAFLAAARVRGVAVTPAPPGQRFWDAIVDGRRISLKSSKAMSLRNDSVHISKLTEAAWIQDCRTARARRDRTRELFRRYCAEVDAIFQLRLFQDANRYELLEVPAAMFRQVDGVPLSCFGADGPTINIPVGQDPADFTLKLDRSDAKITVANIRKTLCTVHGTWEIYRRHT